MRGDKVIRDQGRVRVFKRTMEKKAAGLSSDELLMKAKNDALRLLSFSPRSVSEMRRRLLMKKFKPEIVERVIDTFSHQGLLNDEKFAKLYASSRVFTRPQSIKKLAFELKQKGVAGDITAKALAELGDYDERKAARDLVFTRISKMTGISVDKKKARAFGFLKRRGFSNDTIFSVFNELFKDASGLD